MFAVAASGREAQCLHALPQPLGNGLGRVLRHAGKQKGKFIATDTGDEIVLLDGLAKQGGEAS
ncbi:hypothetical protein D3C78_1427920 [compost metagenome]